MGRINCAGSIKQTTRPHEALVLVSIFTKGYGYDFSNDTVVATEPWIYRDSFSGSGGLRFCLNSSSVFLRSARSSNPAVFRCNIRQLLDYGVANLPESDNPLRDAFDLSHQALYSGEGDPWQV